MSQYTPTQSQIAVQAHSTIALLEAKLIGLEQSQRYAAAQGDSERANGLDAAIHQYRQMIGAEIVLQGGLS